MKTIFKYPLSSAAMQNVVLPADSYILSVKEQRCQLQLWAMVTKNVATETHTVLVLETCDPAPRDINQYVFRGTLISSGGFYVRHIFTKLSS